MRRFNIALAMLVGFLGTSVAHAAPPARAAARTATRTATRTAAPQARTATRPAGQREDQNFARARKLAATGQYAEASKLLFAMSRAPKYAQNAAQIKYILGLMLFEMKLNQSAAFIFYDLIRQESVQNPKSRFLRQGLEKLALAADSLDSDVLLRYAIKQVREDDFPAANRDMLYYRTGEVKMEENNFPEAARQFGRVRVGSQFFNRARYKMGLALAEANDLDRAQAVFEDLSERTKSLGVTNRQHVDAMLGAARVIYQHQKFNDAIEAYRDIPRDTEQWHDALFESTWAMLRDGRFRSALSNFHSLHSAYFEYVYQPESLLLRAIVYLYICRYGEMETTLDLFEHTYQPISRAFDQILSSETDPMAYFNEAARVSNGGSVVKTATQSVRLPIPLAVTREILKEGDVRRSFNYLRSLDIERRRILAQSAAWRGSGVGLFAQKAVEKRIEATRVLAGKQVRRHMLIMQSDLKDLFEQNGFLRFEMISGKKEALRKEIAGKAPVRTQVDENTNRDFYIQNGFEYWPFRGEYWLDELGNYHYVGVQACE